MARRMLPPATASHAQTRYAEFDHQAVFDAIDQWHAAMSRTQIEDILEAVLLPLFKPALELAARRER